MFVKAQSKQRFGDIKEPFINVEQIVSAEIGHEGVMAIKLSNAEEYLVKGDNAQRLLHYLQGQLLQ